MQGDIASLDKKYYIARSALWLNAGIWVVFSLLRWGQSSKEIHYILAGLMLGNALAFGVLGYLVGKKVRLFLMLAIAYMGLNILLGFTDQVGGWDIFVILINTGVLIWLIYVWRSTRIEGETADNTPQESNRGEFH